MSGRETCLQSKLRAVWGLFDDEPTDTLLSHKSSVSSVCKSNAESFFFFFVAFPPSFPIPFVREKFFTMHRYELGPDCNDLV